MRTLGGSVSAGECCEDVLNPRTPDISRSTLHCGLLPACFTAPLSNCTTSIIKPTENEDMHYHKIKVYFSSSCLKYNTIIASPTTIELHYYYYALL